MSKSTLPTLLILLLVCATSAAALGNPSAGLDAACEKTPYADFCAMLLQPYAAEFADNDPKKMGYFAINATVGKMQSLRSYMVSQGLKKAKNDELKAALVDCVDKIGKCESSLSSAVRELNNTAEANAPRKLGKEDPAKMIEGASAELKSCLDALQKCEGSSKGGDGVNADISRQSLRQANDTVLACYVAKAFVVMPAA